MLSIIFLYFCSVLAFVMCGLTINFIQIIMYCTLRPLNNYAYKKVMYYLCYNYFSLYVFLVDWYSNCEITLYMDKKDLQKYWGRELSYIICNHSYEIDWILLLSLADKAHVLGNSKTFCKNDVKYVPGLGLLLHFADYIFLARNYEKDKKIIENTMKEILQYPDPVWVILYPEGTRFSKSKHQNSIHFAKIKGLPTFKHHLTPRPKGFVTSMNVLRDKVKAVYDVTIAFKPSDAIKPKLYNILFGKKICAYFYVRRIPIENVPSDDEGYHSFLNELFIHKDQLRDSFYKHEDFFNDTKTAGVEKVTMKRNNLILLNALFWYISSTGLVLWYLIKLALAGEIMTFIVCSAIILSIVFVMNKIASMSDYNNEMPTGKSDNGKLKH